MVTRRFDPGEIRGSCCPACGRAAGIRRERRNEAINGGHLVLTGILGWIGFVAVMLDRTRVRLRCTTCQCQFPDPVSLPGWILLCTLIGSAAVGIVYSLAMGDPIITAIGAALVFVLAGTTVGIAARRRSDRCAAWHRRLAKEQSTC